MQLHCVSRWTVYIYYKNDTRTLQCQVNHLIPYTLKSDFFFEINLAYIERALYVLPIFIVIWLKAEAFRLALESIQSPIQRTEGLHSREVRRSTGKSDHSPPRTLPILRISGATLLRPHMNSGRAQGKRLFSILYDNIKRKFFYVCLHLWTSCFPIFWRFLQMFVWVSWTGNSPIVKPVPTQDNTNKEGDMRLCSERGSNVWSQGSRARHNTAYCDQQT